MGGVVWSLVCYLVLVLGFILMTLTGVQIVLVA